MKLIIDIPEKIYECCQRDVCREPIRNGRTLYRTVWEAVAKGKPLPKDATNGDVFEAIFSDEDIDHDIAFFDVDWWNEPYKREEE